MRVEAWTDGGLVNDTYPAGAVEFNRMQFLTQWGPPITPDFMGQSQ